MKRHHLGLFIALGLVAAGGEDCALEGGESGTGFPTGGNNPLTIESGTVDCLDDSTVEMTMTTTGPAASAEIFAQETANEGGPGSQWAETTNLDSVGNGMWEQTLDSNAGAPSNVVQDQTSLFRCDTENGNPFHHNADVMTYIFRAFDATETEFDCVVAGDDPSGLIDGDYDAARAAPGPTRAGTITEANCSIASFSY